MSTHDQMLPECRERDAQSREREIRAEEWRKDKGTKIDLIHQILTGNGRPSDGVLYRLTCVERNWLFFKIIAGVVGFTATVLGVIWKIT